MAVGYFPSYPFTQVGPPQYQYGGFEFDRLTIPYKGQRPDLNAFISAFVPWEVAPSDVGMYLTGYTTDNDLIAPTVNKIYTGKKDGIITGQKHEYEDSVLSASSKRSITGQVFINPLTVEYYAPTSILSYISKDAPGTDVAPDPIGDPRVLTVTASDTTFAPGVVIDTIVKQMFQQQIITTNRAEEIVSVKYWKNTSRKIKLLTPYIFNLLPGAYIILYSPGAHYTVGNTLHISAADGFADLLLGEVGGGGAGNVLQWTISANTFTLPHTGLVASGGSGTGARFSVIII